MGYSVNLDSTLKQFYGQEITEKGFLVHLPPGASAVQTNKGTYMVTFPMRGEPHGITTTTGSGLPGRLPTVPADQLSGPFYGVDRSAPIGANPLDDNSQALQRAIRQFTDQDAAAQKEHSAAKATATAPSGVTCSKCGDPNEYASPNQPDGSFKCYRCRGGGI